MTTCLKCGRPFSISGRRQMQNTVCPRGGAHEWNTTTVEALVFRRLEEEEFDWSALARLRKGYFEEGGEA